MNGSIIFLIFVLVLGVVFMWAWFRNQVDSFESDELKFHRVAKKETYFPRIEEMYPDLDKTTSACQCGEYLFFTSKGGDVKLQTENESTTVFNFKSVVEIDTDGEGGLLCLIEKPSNQDMVVSYTIKKDDGQVLVVQDCHYDAEFKLGAVRFTQDYPGSTIHHAG